MLGVDRGGHEVRDLGQGPGGDVGAEGVGEGAALDAAQPAFEEGALGLREVRDALFEQAEEPGPLGGVLRAAHGGVEGLHEGVAAGAGERLAGDLLEGGEELDVVVGEVLPLGVRLPAPPGGFEALGVGGPAVAGVGGLGVRGVGDGPAAVGLVAGPAGPEVVAVGARGGVDRRVVGVADGEGVGQLVVQGDVAPVVVRHGGGGLGRDPAVHPAAAPGLGAAAPGVVEVADVLEVLLLRLGGVPDREGEDGPVGAGGLFEDRAAGGELNGIAVAESADAAEGAEVVVEGTVLLHQDDHVPDRRQPSGVGLRGHRGLQRRRQQRSGRGGAEGASAQCEEPSAGHLGRQDRPPVDGQWFSFEPLGGSSGTVVRRGDGRKARGGPGGERPTPGHGSPSWEGPARRRVHGPGGAPGPVRARPGTLTG